MRSLGIALAVPLLAGCLCREGNLNNIGSYPHQWKLPPDYERKVFGPMPFDEVRDFVRQRESDGWEVVGYELASLPEDVMVDSTELDRPAKAKRPAWTFDIPKTMDDGLDPPAPKVQVEGPGSIPPYLPPGPRVDSIPPYLQQDVRGHRQKYLVIMRRWL